LSTTEGGTVKTQYLFLYALVAMTVVALIGCGSSGSVERVSPDETIDLSGNWNDTDSRLVAEEMIGDCLARPWLAEFGRQESRSPDVIVGTVRNRSTEHISTSTFIKNLERELINSGRVNFVASKEEREEVREERADQQEFSSDQTVKRFQEEAGADFMLIGEITSIVDQAEGERVKYYQVNLELVNVETNRKSWIGEKKIKKYISRDESKF
jgi:uncharacterized protein (TIGR02722 family)